MKNYNAVNLTGRIYDYNLEDNTNNDGDPIIRGKVTLEVDDAGTTVDVDVYASETFTSGDANPLYALLQDIMTGNLKTLMSNGDEADWLSTSGEINVGYFKGRDGGDEAARSQKVPSRLKTARTRKYNNDWKVDMLITRIDDIEADIEKGTKASVKVTGYAVNCKNVKDGNRWVKDPQKLVEVQFYATAEKAMEYIRGLPASNDTPYFVRVWGGFASTSRTLIQKNAFGEDMKTEYKNTSWNITGMEPEPYAFGEENVMTQEEFDDLKTALNDFIAEKMEKAEASDDTAPELAF